MLKNNHQSMHNLQNAAGVISGLVIGSMIGAATMWLYAPQSGKRTRAQIQLKSIELRDRAAEMLDDTAVQMRMESKKLAENGRHKAKEIAIHAQELAKNQLTHIAEVAENGRHAILRS